MNTEQEAFLQQHANGEMTAQQAAQLLELGEGDTGLPEIGGQPSATPANDQTPGDAAASDVPELTPDNAVILARDGELTHFLLQLLFSSTAALHHYQVLVVFSKYAPAAPSPSSCLHLSCKSWDIFTSFHNFWIADLAPKLIQNSSKSC